MNELPAGVKMLLKSFGMDPQVIAQTIGQSVQAFTAKVDEVQASLTRIESKLDYLLALRVADNDTEKQAPVAHTYTLENGG